MLCNTASLTYASRAKPDNMVPVRTIRNLLEKKNVEKDTSMTSMSYCASKLCHRCQHWHVTMCYEVKSTLNKAIYESCLSTTFFCLWSDKVWLTEPHAIFQAAMGLTSHLHILNCTDIVHHECHRPRKTSLPHSLSKAETSGGVSSPG